MKNKVVIIISIVIIVLAIVALIVTKFVFNTKSEQTEIEEVTIGEDMQFTDGYAVSSVENIDGTECRFNSVTKDEVYDIIIEIKESSDLSIDEMDIYKDTDGEHQYYITMMCEGGIYRTCHY